MANDDAVAATSTMTRWEGWPVEAISRHVQDLPNGERAQLRRMYLTGRHEAEGIVARLLIIAGVTIPPGNDAFRPWKMLVHCAAVLSGTGRKGAPSHARRSVGSALHQAGLKENRVLRLLSARGPMLDSILVQTMRRLAQTDVGPVDLFTIFNLLRDREDKAEEARLRIARDFYAADARSKKETASDD